MNKLAEIDAWMIERVAQRVVDAAWSHTGISKKSLCTFIYLLSAAIRVCVNHDFLVIFFITFLSVVCIRALEHNGLWFRDGRVAFGRLLNVALCVFFCIAVENARDIWLAVADFCFTAFLYLAATNDPPPRKRNNWKVVMEKFSAQWTWLPARGTA